MLYHVTVGGRTLRVELGPDGVRVEGEPIDVELAHVEGTPLRSLILDGTSHRVVARRDRAGRWDLHLGGRRLRAEVVDERTRAIREMTGAGAGPIGPEPVRAPMPGMVVKIEVSVGDRVQEGDGVAIVEAMKMENELRASGAGVVTQIHVSEGSAVEKDQLLVDFAPLEPSEEEA